MPLNLFPNSHNNLEVVVQRCLLLLQKEMQLKRVCVNKLTHQASNRNKIKV